MTKEPVTYVLQGGAKVERGRLERALQLKPVKYDRGVYLVPHARPDLEPEWVNLLDESVEPCHCEDYTFRGEFAGMPCKHILAAMLADGHRELTKLKEEWFPKEATG